MLPLELVEDIPTDAPLPMGAGMGLSPFTRRCRSCAVSLNQIQLVVAPRWHAVPLLTVRAEPPQMHLAESRGLRSRINDQHVSIYHLPPGQIEVPAGGSRCESRRAASGGACTLGGGRCGVLDDSHVLESSRLRSSTSSMGGMTHKRAFCRRYHSREPFRGCDEPPCVVDGSLRLYRWRSPPRRTG